MRVSFAQSVLGAFSELEVLRSLPGELVAAEVSVAGTLEVDGTLEI